MKDLLLTYTRYNLWANKRLGDVMLTLGEADVDREIVSSFTSIRKTVYHVWGAEDLWKRRVSQISVTTWASKDFHGSFAEALKSWHETSQWFIDFAASCNEELLLADLTYKNIAGVEYTNKLKDILHHVMNHSTYHRGQLVTMLRQVGVTQLPATDYIAYFR